MNGIGRKNLVGRVAVITGATSGIGRETALGLARQGATTVVVGRGVDRASRVASELSATSGNASVESLRVDDLAVIADTRQLAGALLDRYSAIHILVNNAGAFFRRREVTSDGLERTFALNVLSPSLLTTLLAPRLIESVPARVVNVSSAAHRGARVDFTDLQSARRFSGFSVYGASKTRVDVVDPGVRPPSQRQRCHRERGPSRVRPLGLRAQQRGRNGIRDADPRRTVRTKCRPRSGHPYLRRAAPELASVTGGYFANRNPQPDRTTPATLRELDISSRSALGSPDPTAGGNPPGRPASPLTWGHEPLTPRLRLSSKCTASDRGCP